MASAADAAVWFRPELLMEYAMGSGRQLSLTMQEISECRLQADLFDLEMSGFVAIELAIFLYAIVFMHVLIDEYYVPALELVTSPEVLDLPRPLLGVTIMAAGNCLPELSMSLVALLWSGNQDIGTGEVFGSCVFDLLAILGVVCVRLPADYDSKPSQHLAQPLMLYFLAWTAVATATDVSLFYADVETTWPASMTMVALYVAFVVGAFVCQRIFPGFVGEESASATLPTHALPPTPTAIVASQSRAVGGYQGGGAVGGYQGGGGCERVGGSGAQQAPSAANAAAETSFGTLPSSVATASAVAAAAATPTP